MSDDKGKTWTISKLLQPGATGYSDMALAPDGSICIPYEQVTPKGKHNLIFRRLANP